MINIDKRTQHLKALIEKIDAAEQDETRFVDVYNLLREEYHNEGGHSIPAINGSYHDNLRQTIQKQGLPCIEAKRNCPNKELDNLYDTFIYNFRQDVTTELYGLQD